MAMESGISGTGGVFTFLAALSLALAWWWYHLGAPGRRPHTRTEKSTFLFTVMTLAIPGLSLIWGDGQNGLAAHLVAAAVPTVGLALYLVMRWRR